MGELVHRLEVGTATMDEHEATTSTPMISVGDPHTVSGLDPTFNRLVCHPATHTLSLSSNEVSDTSPDHSSDDQAIRAQCFAPRAAA
jgi:hypothetical protein